MNTKTMRLPPRRVLTSDKRAIPVAGKLPETTVTNPPPPQFNSIVKQNPAVVPPPTTVAAVAEPAGSNQLLAGYLAHEFLSKGTLFGEQWDPVRAQAGPFTAQYPKPKKNKWSHSIEPSDSKRRRYIEVANILRVEGSHLPGIVNPTQLARSIQYPRGSM